MSKNNGNSLWFEDNDNFKDAMLNYMIANYGRDDLDYREDWSRLNILKINEMLLDTEYELCSEYFTFAINSDLTFYHKLCGNTFSSSWLEFCGGKGCECCYPSLGNKDNYILNYYKEEFKRCGLILLENKFDLKFLSNKKKVLCECEDCHAQYRIHLSEMGIITPDIDNISFYNHFRCLECNSDYGDFLYYQNHYNSMRKLPKESFADKYLELIDEWSDLNGAKTPYMFSSSSSEIIYWECPKNRNHPPYPATIVSRTNGKTGCPICRSSHGEKKILTFLKNNNIPYETQYKFDDCRDRRPLMFDFAVFDENYNLRSLIEFQGSQHYFPAECFGGFDQFEDQVKRDQIKVEYCEKNNIPLLVIPYWNYDDVEEILSENL